MLFSCLVDADFLDTERYMQPVKTLGRGNPVGLESLQQHFSNTMAKMQASAEQSELNDIRNEVLDACIQAGSWKPGLVSLTVPTGGGKTLASLAEAVIPVQIETRKIWH